MPISMNTPVIIDGIVIENGRVALDFAGAILSSRGKRRRGREPRRSLSVHHEYACPCGETWTMDLNQLLYHHQRALMGADRACPEMDDAFQFQLVVHFAERIREFRANLGLLPYNSYVVPVQAASSSR